MKSEFTYMSGGGSNFPREHRNMFPTKKKI